MSSMSGNWCASEARADLEHAFAELGESARTEPLGTLLVRGRRLALGLSIVVAPLTLSGCSPAVKGAVGITVTATGQPVAVLSACSSELSMLYVGIDRAEQDRMESVLELTRATPLRTEDGVETVDLIAPPHPWTRITPSATAPVLDASVEYLIGASNEDSSSVTSSTPFKLERLAELSSDTVITVHNGSMIEVDAQAFTKYACD
jgi:hypothetical protein